MTLGQESAEPYLFIYFDKKSRFFQVEVFFRMRCVLYFCIVIYLTTETEQRSDRVKTKGATILA